VQPTCGDGLLCKRGLLGKAVSSSSFLLDNTVDDDELETAGA